MEKEEKTFDLRRLWWVLKKYALWIVICAVIGAAGAGVFTTVTSVTTYTTQSSFLVGPKNPSLGTGGNATTEYYEVQKAKEDAIALVDTFNKTTTIKEVAINGDLFDKDVISLRDVARIKNAVRIGLSGEDSRTIIISVTTKNQKDSVTIARAFEKQLPLYVTSTLKDMNAKLTIIDSVNDKNVSVSIVEGETVEHFHVAPNGNSLKRNVVLGGAALFVLAYLVCFAYDSLDNTVRSSESLGERFPTIPVLGQIPQWSNKKLTRRQKKLEMRGKLRDYDNKLLSDTTSFTVAESFRSLRTNISYIVSGKSTVIGVTSVKSGECKSVVSSNLAVCYAQLKKKVLLVEGDMRLPSIHEIFNITPVEGLPEVLAGMTNDYHRCIHSVNEYLDVLPVGVLTPPNPAELLASDATKALFEKLRREYDLIVLDLPPVGTVSDASIVAGVVDQYLLSTRVEMSNTKTMATVLRDMARLDMKVCGFVLSGMPNGGRYSQSPYYYDSYGQRRRKDETASVQPAEETNIHTAE